MASSGNFPTLNTLKYKASSYTTSAFANANLQLSSKTGNAAQMNIGFVKGDGKFYWECYAASIPGSLHFGVCINNADLNNTTSGKAIIGMRENGNKLVSTAPQSNSTSSSYGSSFASGGDILAVAMDFTNSTMEFFINNSSQGSFSWSSANDGSTYYPYLYMNTQLATMNAGQDSTFCGQKTAQGNSDENGFGDFYYTPPSGALAMCSANLPISSDIDPAETDTNINSKFMTTANWSGTAGSKTITGVGFKPDLTIIKSADQGGQDWCLFDTSRGVEKILEPNTNAAEENNSNSLTAFSTDGFTVGSENRVNGSSFLMTAQCWSMNGGTTATNNDGNVTTTVQANQAAGQSIVQFTGTSSNSRTLGHGLTKKPNFVIVKRRENTQSWNTWGSFNNNGSETGEYGGLFLESTNGYGAGSGALTYWYPAGMTTTTIGVGGASGNNNSGEAMIMYCFHDVQGYSKFNYYMGNGNADGPFVYTGHLPRCVWIKRTDASAEWAIYFWNDTTTNASYVSLKRNPLDSRLTFDAGSMNNGEPVDFLSNGFKIRDSDAILNSDGGTYIYCSWGSVPFKYNNAF